MSSPTSATAPAPPRSSTGSGASSSSRPEPPAPPEDLARVGRDGLLRLAFAARDGRTVLRARRFRLPLQTLEPLDLDGTGAATVMLLNPTGGVLGGDRLHTEITLGPGAHVCVTTPAATRVYRAPVDPALVTTTLQVGPGAVLEYLPDHLIPSPGARLRQRTVVDLDPGATAIVLDAWAAGRAARDEAWQFAELDLALTARDAAGLLLHERAMLAPATAGVAAGPTTPYPALGFAEGFGYVANLTALAPARDGWDALATELQTTLDAVGGGRCGVSSLARGGLAARLLLPSAPALAAAVDAAWGLCRRRLLGRPPLPLRKL